MDIKEIALKSVNGEDVTELVKDFTDEQRLELTKQKLELTKAELVAAQQSRASELEAVAAIRKEKERISEKIKIDSNESAKAVQAKIQAEQLEIAKARLATTLGVTHEDVSKVCEGFTPESMSAEMMEGELKRRWAFMNADKLIQDSQARAEMEKNANEFMAQQAGGGSSGGGTGDNGKTYSPEVYAVVKEANQRGYKMTLEEAERGLNYQPRISQS